MTSRIGLTLSTSFQALAIHSGGHADALPHLTQQTAPAMTSPLANHPPTLIIHGNKDQLVPVTRGIELQQILQENDIRTHLLQNPYGRHIWQSIFNQQILDWFSFGYHTAYPPTQSPEGPGSTNYSHQSIKTTTYGNGELQYWLFEPQNPTPTSAPVIVFNHGWGAQHPSIYQTWIDHLVKKGNIVIYPRYQKTLVFGFKRFTDNAIYAVQQALDELQKPGHVIPELEHFAIVGHSLGGGISTYMAARAATEGLPTPRAVMPVQPALPFGDVADLQLISNETYMVVIVGANDTVVFNYSAIPIFYNTTSIPFDKKDYIIQLSDFYGYPGLNADHGAPTCGYNNSLLITDAMDYYSTWKLFDALTDYAFFGINREYCLDNTPEQRFMGLWSDGTPVVELFVTDSP